MSPNDIEVLLHCHCTPGPHQRLDAPAVLDAVTRFLDAGLIERVAPSEYRTTEGGRVLVEALCAVPWPVRRWVMP